MIEILKCVDEKVTTVTLDELRAARPWKDGFFWLDLDAATPEESRAVLEDLFAFHPLTVEDCGLFVDHPKLEDYDDYLFLVFHSPFYHEKELRLAVWELDFFIAKNFLVTNHLKPVTYLPRIKEKFRKGDPHLVKGTDFLAQHILDTMVSQYYPALTKINRKLDEVEREVLTQTDRDTISDIVRTNRNLTVIEKVLIFQEEVLADTIRYENRFFSPDCVVYLRDISNHLERLRRMVESYIDVGKSTFDANLSITTLRMNAIMKRLTIITTIFMPLTVLTGIGGMSEWSMMTGANAENWWAPYALFIAVMFVLSGGTWIILRRKGWT